MMMKLMRHCKKKFAATDRQSLILSSHSFTLDRYRVLQGELRLRVRRIIAQVAEEMGIKIINGVLSADHIHIFASIPPNIAVSEFVKIAKGRSSRKIQQEYPEIRKKYWGRHFWGRGYFSTTSGNVTDDIINAYINNHVDSQRSENETNISLE